MGYTSTALVTVIAAAAGLLFATIDARPAPGVCELHGLDPAPTPVEAAAPSGDDSAGAIAVAAPAPPTASRSREGPALRHDIHVGRGVDPDATLPMVIALHGRGGSPAFFRRHIRRFREPVRWVLPRAPGTLGRGHTWFTTRVAAARRTEDQQLLAREIEEMTDLLAADIERLVAEHPTRGRPIVIGFSQGAMLAWSLALRHGQLVDAAVPVAGFLPDLLRDVDLAAGGDRPPIVALHGKRDRRIRLRDARRTTARVGERGVPARIRTYDEAGHELSPRMRRDLFKLLRRTLALQQAGGPGVVTRG